MFAIVYPNLLLILLWQLLNYSIPTYPLSVSHPKHIVHEILIFAVYKLRTRPATGHLWHINSYNIPSANVFHAYNGTENNKIQRRKHIGILIYVTFIQTRSSRCWNEHNQFVFCFKALESNMHMLKTECTVIRIVSGTQISFLSIYSHFAATCAIYKYWINAHKAQYIFLFMFFTSVLDAI